MEGHEVAAVKIADPIEGCLRHSQSRAHGPALVPKKLSLRLLAAEFKLNCRGKPVQARVWG